MSGYIPVTLRRAVIERAKGCCEYCQLHYEDAFFSHEIDHIIAEKHRGKTEIDNLCLSCFDCNRRKGTDFASFDDETNEVAMLFNPRRQNWNDHFQLDDARIIPLTPEGRVTVYLLQMNSSEQLTKRRELLEIHRYPC